MLFERRLRDGIHDGSITVAFRAWKRPQVKVGGIYETGLDRIEMLAVDMVELSDIDHADACAAGFADIEQAASSIQQRDGTTIYRLRFRRTAAPAATAARDELAHDVTLDDHAVETIRKRLDRMDRDAGCPWTARTLAVVRDHPATRSAELAPLVDMDQTVFKKQMRKLKNLGLTLSLQTGYELSPRGQAWLDRPAS